MVLSSELLVGATLNSEYALTISYYHPATGKYLLVLAKHFASPLRGSSDGEVTFRYPELIDLQTRTTGEGTGGFSISTTPSEEVDFDLPSKGVWPSPPRVWVDLYISRVGQGDFFHGGRKATSGQT